MTSDLHILMRTKDVHVEKLEDLAPIEAYHTVFGTYVDTPDATAFRRETTGRCCSRNSATQKCMAAS